MNEPISILHASPRLRIERDDLGRMQRVSLGNVEITGLCRSVSSVDTDSGTEHVIVLRTFTPKLQRVAQLQGADSMTWMLTATGAMVDLEFAPGADVRIDDIAHHLAQLNRYTGACSRPYSVAEHSLLVCDVLRWMPNLHLGPQVLMAGLLHDAHEAYVADLSSPMKLVLGEAWRQAEDRAQAVVLERFGVLDAFRAFAPAIKTADMQALVTERMHLLPDTGPRWAALDRFEPVRWVDWEGRSKLPWTHWRDAYLHRFNELDRVRRAQLTAATGA